jgi:broad specificity phosphatase PhoE
MKQSGPKKLLLARHCETGPDYAGRFVGSSDIGLGPNGPEQARRLAGVMTGYRPDTVYCSPLRRARQTVELLGEHIELGEPVLDDDLREIDFGRWEGLTFDEIVRRDAELVKDWAAWSPDFAFPDGEVTGDFLARVHGAGNRLAGSGAGTILVVAHGGVVRAMLCHLLRLPPEHYLLFDIKPARLAVIDLFPEGGVLSGLNL